MPFINPTEQSHIVAVYILKVNRTELKFQGVSRVLVRILRQVIVLIQLCTCIK